jgi:hypothetical protein
LEEEVADEDMDMELREGLAGWDDGMRGKH